MTIQHKSLEDEILFILGRSSAPLDAGQVYERVELADEPKQVSNALYRMKHAKKITPVEHDSRRCYQLADGVAAPAPAGKSGRSRAVQKDDAAAAQSAPLTGIRPAVDPMRRTAPAAAGDDEISKGLDLVQQHAAPEVSGDLYARAKNSTQVEDRLKDERLADAILARLKRQLAPTLCELEAAAGMDRLNVHIHIEQVDVHLGGL